MYYQLIIILFLDVNQATIAKKCIIYRFYIFLKEFLNLDLNLLDHNV